MIRTAPWPARASWLVAAVLSVPALRATLHHHSAPLHLVAAAELWGLWAVALVATLVPRTVSLTVYRAIAPLSLVAGVAALADHAPLGTGLLASCAGLVATGVALSRWSADAFVDGSSYGPEQRFALRTPVFLLAGPVPLTWALTTLWLGGPLLLAARQWVPGLALTVGGLVIARFTSRTLHALARRWVVLVPAGLVLHDPLVLADAILIPRRQIATLGPALVDTDATDLTQGAAGLALEARLTEPVDLSLREGRRAAAASTSTDRLLFAPARPGALLAAAADHKVTVG